MLSDEGVVFDIGDDEETGPTSIASPRSSAENKSPNSDSDKENGQSRSRALAEQPVDRTDYRATSDSPDGVVGQGWSFHTPMPSHTDEEGAYFESKSGSDQQAESSTPGGSRARSGSRLRQSERPPMRPRARSSVYVEQNLPSTLARPLSAWLDRVGMLFTPEWRLTTVLVWCAWWGMSLGMFAYSASFTHADLI